MNTDELTERIHRANALKRQKEHRKTKRLVWRIAIPSAAVAAAVLLIVLLPHGNKTRAATPPPGIYCNSQCSPNDVMALIDNNINHIREIQKS